MIKPKEEKTTRIGLNFAEELNDIRQERLKRGNDKKKISDRRLTTLIPKHKKWPVIKEEMINLTAEEIKDVLKESNFNEK